MAGNNVIAIGLIVLMVTSLIMTSGKVYGALPIFEAEVILSENMELTPDGKVIIHLKVGEPYTIVVKVTNVGEGAGDCKVALEYYYWVGVGSPWHTVSYVITDTIYWNESQIVYINATAPSYAGTYDNYAINLYDPAGSEDPNDIVDSVPLILDVDPRLEAEVILSENMELTPDGKVIIHLKAGEPYTVAVNVTNLGNTPVRCKVALEYYEDVVSYVITDDIFHESRIFYINATAPSSAGTYDNYTINLYYPPESEDPDDIIVSIPLILEVETATPTPSPSPSPSPSPTPTFTPSPPPSPSPSPSPTPTPSPKYPFLYDIKVWIALFVVIAFLSFVNALKDIVYEHKSSYVKRRRRNSNSKR